MDSPTTTTTTTTAETTAIQAPSDQDLRVPCFCEENVWRLVYRHLHGPNNNEEWNYYVVFISAKGRDCPCPFFRQRAYPDNPGACVYWDYHVIAIRSRIDERSKIVETEVLDVDTYLPYPCPLGEYLDGSFPHATNPELDEQFMPFFRVVSAEKFLRYFYSDRMHMFRDGRWLSPPPAYAPIMNGLQFAHDDKVAADKEDESKNNNISNLDAYIDMMTTGKANEQNGCDLEEKQRGEVFSLAELRDRFTGCK